VSSNTASMPPYSLLQGSLTNTTPLALSRSGRRRRCRSTRCAWFHPFSVAWSARCPDGAALLTCRGPWLAAAHPGGSLGGANHWVGAEANHVQLAAKDAVRQLRCRLHRRPSRCATGYPRLHAVPAAYQSKQHRQRRHNPAGERQAGAVHHSHHDTHSARQLEHHLDLHAEMSVTAWPLTYRGTRAFVAWSVWYHGTSGVRPVLGDPALVGKLRMARQPVSVGTVGVRSASGSRAASTATRSPARQQGPVPSGC
jgi:hypothetical protein